MSSRADKKHSPETRYVNGGSLGVRNSVKFDPLGNQSNYTDLDPKGLDQNWSNQTNVDDIATLKKNTYFPEAYYD